MDSDGKQLYKFSPSLIMNRMEKKEVSFRSLSRLTKEYDPDGQGIAAMTCSRILLDGADPKVSTLFMICSALGISPRSTFIKIEKMKETAK